MISPNSHRRALWQAAVAGGGLVGLCAALSLRKLSGGRLAVEVFDPAFARPPRSDGRASAIAASGQRLLARLGIWGDVVAAAQPIARMTITDSRLDDPIRPVFLTFDQPTDLDMPFAWMVANDVLAGALQAACVNEGVVLTPLAIASCRTRHDTVELVLSDGTDRNAALLVAADGARSRLREAAGIGWVGWDYPQTGLVATIAHQRDHHGEAIEHFLPSGPFAVLPLPEGGPLGHRSSIVWTENKDEARRVLALPSDDLLAEIERRFGLEWGEIALEGRLHGYPLSYGIARDFAAQRLVLIGDAAHVIHPIAGQGLNLGLNDIAALCDAVLGALHLGLDPAADDILRAYDRARRSDTVTMGVATDGLNRLFSNDVLPIRLLRDLGLGLVERMPRLKDSFIRRAAGG